MTLTRTNTCRHRSVTRAARRRTGVTLIELLVVMAIITGLGLLALMLLPNISNSDAALKATETVRANVKISQALAAGSGQPRGVRFLVGNNPGQPRVATELQLIESPPVTAFDATALSVVSGTSNSASGLNKVINAPRVDIIYDLYNGTETSIDPNQPGVVPQAGTIKKRHCYLVNLQSDQLAQITPGALLSMPTLGAWSRINGTIGNAPTPPYAASGAGSGIEVALDVYPDTTMGSSTAYRTYHAGIYGPPVPLLGQATIQLHSNIGVDLEVSSPSIQDLQLQQTGFQYYDVMFSPDGQTVTVGAQANNAGVYLWVRDITKTTNPAGANQKSMLKTDFGSPALWLDGFRRGGEHHAVAISNGFVGVAPIQWPDNTGTFPQGAAKENVFAFARKKVN